MRECITTVVGIDLGDRFSQYCLMAAGSGEIVEEGRLLTREESLRDRFAAAPPMRVVIETGTHASWVARLVRSLGHEVLVASARHLRCIYEADQKDDRVDARMLAKVGRLDPSLLHPVRTRSQEVDLELAVLRARDVLVAARTKVMNSVRGLVKRTGQRLPRLSAESFAVKARPHVPNVLRDVLEPLLDSIAGMTSRIREYDAQVERLCGMHPETARLRQVAGVGPVTSLAFVLVIEDPHRFSRSREVGPYLGLVPRRDSSGSIDRQLRITKSGDRLMRRLLVGSAHYIIGPFGPDTDLARFGRKMAERGGKIGRKRAAVAVARRLGVLLHRLWVSGEVYRPLRTPA